MLSQKSFVRSDGTATIICPTCNVANQISAEVYRYKNHSLAIRCTCKTKFKVALDFRSHYRKKTDLPGIYSILDSNANDSGSIQICNISQGGIGFTVSNAKEIKKGQTLHLEFRLNDKNQTKLAKQALVCTIENNYIGCQFINQDLIEKALGFYLRP